MKVGMTFTARYPVANAEAAISLAEKMELDSLWTVDHLMGTQHPVLWSNATSGAGGDPDAFFDPFSLLAAVGAKTALPLGTCVTDTTRRGAADLARTALSLHHLCRGGFKLGLGSGEAENLLPFGYDFDRPVRRTEEVLIPLRQLLDDGTYPETVGRLGLPLENEAGRPEIWLAAHGPRMLRLAGQYADGWLPAFVTDPAIYRAMLETMTGHADKAGRRRPEAGLQPFLVLGESRERLREQFEEQPTAKLFALFCDGKHWQRYGIEHPLGPESRGFIDVVVHEMDPEMLRELAPDIPFELIDDVMCLGGVEEVVAKLTPYVEAGCEHLVLGNMTGLVGGRVEFAARVDDFPVLAAALREL